MRRLLIYGLPFVAILLVAGVALTRHAAIKPISPPTAFGKAEIQRGAELAAIGDCAVCHTAPGGPSYAGGRAVPTPFGAVYATNITPDAKTGIGAWSLSAFTRTMRDGIDREGNNLYPVLPYPHFTRASDDDIAALYAFIMTRAPVHQATPPNALPFPLDQRRILAGWNLLYLRPGPWRPDPSRDAVWNRGSYLVEAVGHCGACHSPHNSLGAEISGKSLAGGEAEGWYAPPLQGNGQPWTAAALTTYLRNGLETAHGAAAGPMTAVTDELAGVPQKDVEAIAAYIASMTPDSASQAPRPQAAHAGDPKTVALFGGACGGCHGADAPMTLAGAPPLSLSAAVNAPTARSAIRIILQGIPWRDGKVAPYMPAFADALTNEQVARLVAYLRATYTSQPPWPNLPTAVSQARQEGGT